MRRHQLAMSSIRKARDWLAAEVRSPGTQHSTIVLAGYICRFALGFAASVLLARTLGPAGYGLIALVASVLALADTLGDFGLTYAAVRAISRNLGMDPDHVRWLAHGYLSLAFVANAAAAAIGIALAEPIARLALGQPEAEPYIRLALLGLVSVAGNGFAAALLQATRRFGQLAILQVFTATTYLIGIIALFVIGQLSVGSVILLGVLNPLAGFFVGLRLLPAGLVSLTDALALPARRTWPELAAFGKWLWVSGILSLLASQLDLLLLNRWAPFTVVGVYALAFNIAMKLDLFNQSRLTVLLPSVSSLRTAGEMRSFTVKSLKRSLLIGAGFALAIPGFHPFIVTFYGPAYADAAGILIVLTAVVIFDLVTSPVILLGFPLDQPRALAVSDVLRVVALLAAGWLLIPMLGPIGAALARLISRIAGALFMFALIAIRLRKLSGLPLQIGAEPARGNVP